MGQYWGDEDLSNVWLVCGNDDYYSVRDRKEVGGDLVCFCCICERSSGNWFGVMIPEVAVFPPRDRLESISEAM